MAVAARPDWAGAKAAAEPIRRETAAIFMVSFEIGMYLVAGVISSGMLVYVAVYGGLEAGLRKGSP